MTFIHEEFLLHSGAARRLYHNYAEDQPILDFHCHLSPKVIAENRPFRDLTEICLEGDHYKWRAMRANGVQERFCTGDADPYEKFQAWAATVPRTLRNPLYHWTHLELVRYFGIHDFLDEKSAPSIWRRANERLQSAELTPQGILKRFGVTTVCTTDDPASSLEFHGKIERDGVPVRVFPSFRPDGALRSEDSKVFNQWVDKLAMCTGSKITNLTEFLGALRERHDDFHVHGGRLSDHGLNRCFAEPCDEREAESIFSKVRRGEQATPVESEKLHTYFMLFFGRLDAEKGWTKQLHLGALRNVNSRMLASLGPDTGYDSMSDRRQAASLTTYMDHLEKENALPKMILFNVNPVDNYLFATIAGSFQGEGTAGKIQFGSGWWFLDQKEGMEMQLNALSNCGLLSRFVGMVTDSRSFLSFPRHEYFRRVLCNLLGEEMEQGLLPNDYELVGGLVKDICFENASKYLALPTAVDSVPALPGRQSA